MDSPTRSGRSALHDPEPCNPDGRPYFRNFDPTGLPSPAFVVDRAAVEHNLRILRDTADASGARMLLALKAFALPGMMDLVDRYLDGACASGVYEARLGRETLSGSVHSFAPAYSAGDLALLLQLSDHISFNSLLDKLLQVSNIFFPSKNSALNYQFLDRCNRNLFTEKIFHVRVLEKVIVHLRFYSHVFSFNP